MYIHLGIPEVGSITNGVCPNLAAHPESPNGGLPGDIRVFPGHTAILLSGSQVDNNNSIDPTFLGPKIRPLDQGLYGAGVSHYVSTLQSAENE